MRHVNWFAGLVVVLICAGGLNAQGTDVQRLDRALRQAEQHYQMLTNPSLSLGERALLDYGGLAEFSFAAIDDANQATHILRQTDVQLFGRLNIDDAHEFFGRLRFNYQDFNDGDSFDGRGDELERPLGDRYWYRFDLRRAVEATEGRRIDDNITLTVGRQYIAWGNELALSLPLYAATGTVELGGFEMQWLAGFTPGHGVVDFDSSRPNFDRDTKRGFFGGKFTCNALDDHHPYAYVLHQRDYNDESTVLVLTLSQTPLITRNIPTAYQYDSTYIGFGSDGVLLPRLAYSAEFVYETGDSMSTSLEPGATIPVIKGQHLETIDAWAGKVELAYLVPDDNQTRLEGEVLFASGDPDRDLSTSNTFGGNAPGTTDRAFNGFGFAKTGLSFAAPISNLLLFRASASTFPLRDQKLFRNLQIGIDLLWFNKFDGYAPINEPTTNDRYLGFETDLFAAWRVTSDVALNLRYGVFFPGAGIAADHDPRHFVFAGVSYSF